MHKVCFMSGDKNSAWMLINPGVTSTMEIREALFFVFAVLLVRSMRRMECVGDSRER